MFLLLVHSFWYLLFFVVVVFLLVWMVLLFLSFIGYVWQMEENVLLFPWFLSYFKCLFCGNLNDKSDFFDPVNVCIQQQGEYLWQRPYKYFLSLSMFKSSSDSSCTDSNIRLKVSNAPSVASLNGTTYKWLLTTYIIGFWKYWQLPC